MLQWMRIGVPLVLLLLPLCWLWLVRVQFPVRLELSDTVRREIADELGALPPMSGGERIVLVVFTATALAWVFRPQLVVWTGIEAISDALIAMAGSLLLFVFPVDVRTRTFALDWETAERLPWGILLLFGGGLTLAAAISANGVDSWIAGAFTGLEGLPTFWLMVVVTTVVIFLTELTSNTAVANTFIPILAAVAVGMGAAPMPVLFGAALAATCAFMLPVATPPNAIAFASGQVTIAQMMRAGFVLNLLAIAAISLSIELFGPWLLPVF
jgi:sodium-dependent dicarboxylate transporter 2/3/5